MMRGGRIRIIEPRSGLDTIATLLDAVAPQNAAALWALAGSGRPFPALHAMWTGPEISLQIAAAAVPATIDLNALPLENATTYPAAGDIALVAVAPGEWPEMPNGFLDLGLFYAPDARLLLPHGRIEVSVCARIAPDSIAAVAEACRAIRHNGACALHLMPLR